MSAALATPPPAPPPSAPAKPAAAAPPAPPQTPPKPVAAPAPTGDHFADLDAAIDESVKPKTPPPEPKKPDAPKPADKAPEKPATPEPKPEAGKEPKWYREEMAKWKPQLDTAQSEVTRLQAELAEARRNGEPVAALTTELETAKRERAELQQELSRARYSASPEVKAAQENYAQSAAGAKRVVETLTITNEDGTTRKGSWAKLQNIIATMEVGDAIDAIETEFGNRKDVAMAQYWKVHDSMEACDRAETKDRQTWNERVTRESAEGATKRQAFLSTIKQVEADLVKNRSEWYAEDPSDPEGNALMKKGEAAADVALGAQYHTLTEPQKAAVIANSRLKIKAFPRLVYRLGKANAEISALKARIAEFEEGEKPPTAKTSTGDAPTKEESVFDELDKEADKFRA